MTGVPELPKRRRGRPPKVRPDPDPTPTPDHPGPVAPNLPRGALSTAVRADLVELEHDARGSGVWQWLSMRPPKLWPSLVAELPSEQKISLIVHLLCKGHAAPTVANQLGLMPNFVRDIWRDYATRIGEDLLGITLPVIVGRLEARAEELVDMAVRQDRPDRAWKIEAERVKMLQDLGIVERATKRFEVAHTHTLKSGDQQDSETQAEIARMIELEKKKREGEERVKRIDARVMDSLPTGTAVPEDDDDE